MSSPIHVEVDGRELAVTNLDKVLYPSGFTKAQVIDYMVRIAPVAVPHLAGRAITFRRFPDGTQHAGFFEKRCPSHRPSWVETATGPGDRNGEIESCRIESAAAMAWAANLAAIELHAPMALAADLDTPRAVVFDLDPGAPATIVECCRVALAIADVLASVGLESHPKTSGSKGLQLYVPLNQPDVTHAMCADFALAVGQLLERSQPKLVVTEMTKSRRVGKVLIDWSQNARHKTTIAPYSLRARPEPTVSTPVDWDEVANGADGAPLAFDSAEVLTRVAERGDLFAAVLDRRQELPGASVSGR